MWPKHFKDTNILIVLLAGALVDEQQTKTLRNLADRSPEGGFVLIRCGRDMEQSNQAIEEALELVAATI